MGTFQFYTVIPSMLTLNIVRIIIRATKNTTSNFKDPSMDGRFAVGRVGRECPPISAAELTKNY